MNVFEQFPAMVKKLPVTLNHLVHVGAHEGQEVEFYRQAGIEQITLVEPIPELAYELRQKYPDVEVIEIACGSEFGYGTLTIMNHTNLSTLLPPTSVDKVVEEITVRVQPLRSIALTADCAVIDAQGLELDVLKSADLSKYKMVVVETCTVDDPTMASSYDDVIAYMHSFGFVQHTYWARDYQDVYRWARRHRTSVKGEIRDVVFLREGVA